MALRVREVRPIATSEYPTAARRPAWSVLGLARLKNRFGIETPDWRAALAEVLDEVS